MEDQLAPPGQLLPYFLIHTNSYLHLLITYKLAMLYSSI